ncbi:MAG: adenylyl-sulfate kinase [Rhodospirillaceae bacterium]|jgi:cytidine diphosphoramidate kinase|nr:adenylyl-sulfate kinase [Rhodospirillaceae bacterium]MBT5896776.1 adenylyl-sulfate kinase [Rhodospirillaceae bacterium]MBT6428579.1 adenylyl-sulfate kinase [Rhodospirillaceae bacterium]MBT7757675.1 adenylyl-sulfate kinase [Rhodospirillaceae bacterium]
MIVWLVGLSGAGKTTVARELHRRWQDHDPATVLIDGDEVREIFQHDRGTEPYTLEGRRINAERITAMSAWLDKQNINAVVSILCIFPDILAANRSRFSSYFEAFVDAPLADLEARDGKGLYAAARRGDEGNVVGIDIPFPRPENPDLVIRNDGPRLDAVAVAGEILSKIGIMK